MKITPVHSSPTHPLSPIIDWCLFASPGDAIDVTELPIEYAAMTPEYFSAELIEVANMRESVNTDGDYSLTIKNTYHNLGIEIEILGRGRTHSGFRITRK